jgi:hypothetical protein
VYPIFKKRQQVIALMPIESSARTDAEAASIVQRQLDKLVTEYNHLLKRKHASPIAVQVLEDMGKRLPDDTWAQTFEIKPVANAPTGQHPREVIVQGETGSGGKLLQLVQESTLLKDPVLKAAMTRVSPTAERFHFAGELVAVAAPPGLVLSDSTTLLGTPMQVTPNSAAGAPATATPSAVSGAPSAATKAPSSEGKSSASDSSVTAPAATSSQSAPAKGVLQQPQPSSPKEASGTIDSFKKSINSQTAPTPQINGAKGSEVAPAIVQPEKKS